jgi:hypothetical protein
MMRGHTQAGIAIIYAMVIVGLVSAKLAGHIAWAWWIVLSPIWAPFALIIVAVIVSLALLGGAMGRGENPFQ